MKIAVGVAVLVLLSGIVPETAQADGSRWGTAEDPTVRAMVAVEKMWAQSACAPQPGLKDVIADDFQGTSTKGGRYGKAEAITTDLNALARECQLGDVKVRFFGDEVAIAYGAESRMQNDASGQMSKRCQVWTDTWLKREGKWQIVAAQDTVVACK